MHIIHMSSGCRGCWPCWPGPKACLNAIPIIIACIEEKISVDELVAVMKQPAAVFSATPQDYTFPNIYDRNGS
jgi:hypothetical protein